MFFPFRIAMLALATGLTLSAQAGLLVPSSTGHPDSKVLSLREMQIDIGIARGYARVNIRQIFENHTGTEQEGTYRFALPPSASVGDFAVWDGVQRIPGVILEKRRARSIYQEITRQNIDPGLLQQGEEEDHEGGDGSPRPSGGALFSVSVSPIPPNGTKRLEIQFNQEVPIINALGEFRLPLQPPDGESPVAGRLTVRVHMEDGQLENMASGFPLTISKGMAEFKGQKVKLDKDLRFRIRPGLKEGLRLSAFRNPEGRMPDGLALAPWERPSEIPPEKDGFFLLEAMVGGSRKGDPKVQKTTRPGLDVAICFESSLAHRWGGLEVAYGQLVRLLGQLQSQDRFVLLPFDRQVTSGQLQSASQTNVEKALKDLRQRSLGPGSNLIQVIQEARKALGESKTGRILLITSGQHTPPSKALKTALGNAPLFTFVSTGQPKESLLAASSHVVSPNATDIETDLFFDRLLTLEGTSREGRSQNAELPFKVTGGEAKLRDIYDIMVSPMEKGSLSGWIGRYGQSQPSLTFELKSPLLPGGKQSLQGSLPEKALESRDLPRRWARARVDDLLMRIEREGERREWVEEIIALSKRYKFVTPYTAFLAAPRALLRPRRIQPGDPVIRVECDPGTRAAKALLPFGQSLDLVRQPGTNTWEGRFMAPENFPEGRHTLRILIQDQSGALLSENKTFVLDGKAPKIEAQLPKFAKGGERLTLKVKTDEDVIVLNARVGDSAPVTLRWDNKEKCSVGHIYLPEGSAGRMDVFFEAVDAAKNRGFAMESLEVRK